MSQADLIGALDDVEAELLAREPIFHRPELGVTARRTHDTVRILMPEPFGRRRCLGFAEPDHGWLGIIAGGRRLRTYVCFRERSLHRAMVAANAAGALGRIPRGILGSGYGTTATDEPIRHRIALLRDGTTLAARSVRCAGDYAAASKSTVIMADALSSRDAPHGVFGPEELFVSMNSSRSCERPESRLSTSRRRACHSP